MLQHTRRIAGCSSAVALLLASCTSEQAPTPVDAPANVTQTTATQASVPATESAAKAYIDPVTGNLRDPTPAELAAESAAEAAARKRQDSLTASQPRKPSREIIRADGSVEVLLDQSADHALQGCVQKDGSIVMDHDCKTDATGAK